MADDVSLPKTARSVVEEFEDAVKKFEAEPTPELLRKIALKYVDDLAKRESLIGIAGSFKITGTKMSDAGPEVWQELIWRWVSVEFAKKMDGFQGNPVIKLGLMS